MNDVTQSGQFTAKSLKVYDIHFQLVSNFSVFHHLAVPSIFLYLKKNL